MLFPHPLQRGTDQVAIRLEETGWNPGRLGFDGVCAILEHSSVFHRIFLRDDIRYAVAIDDGFSIESKQGVAELWVKSLQFGPPVLIDAASAAFSPLFKSGVRAMLLCT